MVMGVSGCGKSPRIRNPVNGGGGYWTPAHAARSQACAGCVNLPALRLGRTNSEAWYSWYRGVVMAKKRIGILTGGGDVPGLNSVIKTVTYRSSENDIEVIGLRRGWEALTHVNLDDAESRRRYLMPLNRENTRTIDRRGGTVLHSSRTNPSKVQKLPDHLVGKDFPLSPSSRDTASKSWDLSSQALANLSALGIEHLIAIGGDDTRSHAAKLNELGAT